jgi:hypothetical protein
MPGRDVEYPIAAPRDLPSKLREVIQNYTYVNLPNFDQYMRNHPDLTDYVPENHPLWDARRDTLPFDVPIKQWRQLWVAYPARIDDVTGLRRPEDDLEGRTIEGALESEGGAQKKKKEEVKLTRPADRGGDRVGVERGRKQNPMPTRPSRQPGRGGAGVSPSGQALIATPQTLTATPSFSYLQRRLSTDAQRELFHQEMELFNARHASSGRRNTRVSTTSTKRAGNGRDGLGEGDDDDEKPTSSQRRPSRSTKPKRYFDDEDDRGNAEAAEANMSDDEFELEPTDKEEDVDEEWDPAANE